MRCIIISPENKQEFKNVQSITLTTSSGELQILPDHAESFIAFYQGKVVLANKKSSAISVKDGLCNIKDNIATIIL